MSEWKELYDRAALETDQTRLLQLIQETEAAILERTKTLPKGPDGDGERVAMAEACLGLLALKNERLGWPYLKS
jgi:hypothetical protein